VQCAVLALRHGTQAEGNLLLLSLLLLLLMLLLLCYNLQAFTIVYLNQTMIQGCILLKLLLQFTVH
jgi:hypothetical protein